MKHIKLTNGMIVHVDDDLFAWLNQWFWHAKKGRNTYYAKRKETTPDGQTITILMHRLIIKAPSHLHVDHINGDGLDNRLCNLRLATFAQNQWNARKRKGESSFRGVRFQASTGKWRALIHLGSFATEIEAAQAYDRVAKLIRGEYAKLNLPL